MEEDNVQNEKKGQKENDLEIQKKSQKEKKQEKMGKQKEVRDRGVEREELTE